jgi:photosystem II stability/assembly factor-like uncharacterized protein
MSARPTDRIIQLGIIAWLLAAPLPVQPATIETSLPPPPGPVPPDFRPTSALPIDPPAPVGPAWVALGPAPIPNGQTEGRTDPVSGRVTAIAVHPANANIVYVGTAQGGVYRSLNGGTTWTMILDGARSVAIGALALAPSNPSLLYVGTGEANLSVDSHAGVGLYRVDNADTSATLVGPIGSTTFSGLAIGKIAVHPTQPGIIFIGTTYAGVGIGGSFPPSGPAGLYRSVNADGAFGSITIDSLSGLGANEPINDVLLDPTDATGNTLVVWQDNYFRSDGGVFRSLNALAAAGSVTFANTLIMNTPFPNIRGFFSYYQQGANPTVIYLADGEDATLTSCGSSTMNGALRRSTDGGQTWSGKLSGGGGFADDQAWYDIGLAVAPGATTSTSDDIVHLGGNVHPATCEHLHALSTDGGSTFTDFDTGLHADTHAIVIAPSDVNTVYHGNDGGIWKSTDGGHTWTSLNNSSFSATQFQSLALHPTDRNFMIGGTQDNGTPFMRPDGTWTRADFGDGGYALIDTNATDTINVTMYHTYSGIGFARVTTTNNAHDNGWTFIGCGSGAGVLHCSDTALFYPPMALGPGNPNPLYFGTDRLYRSSNQGTTMSIVSQGPFASGVAVSAIGISPQNDNVRIVGLQNGQVFATPTGANPLTDVTGSIPAHYVARAIIDPNTTTTAYVALGGSGLAAGQHIWKTTTLGGANTWSAAGSGIPDVPVNALVVDPANSSTLYAGTDIGVYRSIDGGANWIPYGTGMPLVAVYDLAIQSTHRILRVVSHGRGMYELDVSLCSSHPAPVAGPDNLGAKENTPVDVPVAKLLANDTTSTGTISLTSVNSPGTSGGTVALVGGGMMVEYTPPNSTFVGTDTFTYNLSDGTCTALGTVTVSVSNTNFTSLNVVFGPAISGGNFLVRFAGIPGYTYTIESAGSLTGPWTKEQNVSAPTDNSQGFGVGVFQFQHSTAGSQGFYRTVYPSY